MGEVQLAVNFCLLALPGVRIEQLKRVISHPQVNHLFPDSHLLIVRSYKKGSIIYSIIYFVA